MTTNGHTYNPGFLSDDELTASFCVRTNEFESIKESLHESTGEANQHVIVIGPRGSGKTTLLLRLVAELRSDQALSSRLLPVVFAEESYEVGTCGEFWLEALSRLADQASDPTEQRDLRRSIADIHREHDDHALQDRCLGALLDYADRHDKRLVLVVENLNMMFADMRDDDAGWRLRKTLQTESRILMLGSAHQQVRRDRQAGPGPVRPLQNRAASASRLRRMRRPMGARVGEAPRLRTDAFVADPYRRQSAVVVGRRPFWRGAFVSGIDVQPHALG